MRSKVFLAASVLALSACSSIISSKMIAPNAPPEKGKNPQSAVLTAAVITYALPRAMIKIDLKEEPRAKPGEPRTNKWTVTPSAEIIPDDDYRFGLNYEDSWFSADAVNVKVSNGLLSTVYANTDDRTSETIINIARSAGALSGFTFSAKPRAPTDGAAPVDGTAAVCFKPERNEELYYDPRENELPPGFEIPNRAEIFKKYAYTDNDDCKGGICTRPIRAVVAKLTVCKIGNTAQKTFSTILYVPDESKLMPVNLERTVFADKCTSLGFENGMLTSVKLKHQSAAENLARLPESVVRALVAVPTELIQLKFNYDTAQLAAAQQEAAYRNFLAGKAAGEGGKKGDPYSVAAPSGILPGPSISDDCPIVNTVAAPAAPPTQAEAPAPADPAPPAGPGTRGRTGG